MTENVYSWVDLLTVMVIAAESRAMKLALSAFVATTVQEPARWAVKVVPETEQMPPVLVTA